jgi:hypothetical protein
VNRASELLARARALGLRLEPFGDRLAVSPRDRCPPGFAEELRAAKAELLDLLEGQAAGLPPDCAPWLHIAQQVLGGEFGGGDRSLLESLLIGVRGVGHPVCRAAKARLETMLAK